jgi:hypothetical protein
MYQAIQTVQLGPDENDVLQPVEFCLFQSLDPASISSPVPNTEPTKTIPDIHELYREE